MASKLTQFTLALVLLAAAVQSAPQVYPGVVYPQPVYPSYPQPGVVYPYPPVTGGVYPGGVYPVSGVYPIVRAYPLFGGSILGNLARAGANIVGTAAAILR